MYLLLCKRSVFNNPTFVARLNANDIHRKQKYMYECMYMLFTNVYTHIYIYIDKSYKYYIYVCLCIQYITFLKFF